MEEEFKCEICHQKQQHPTLLPCCMHSICRSHVESPCPICLTEFPLQSVQANIILETALEHMLESTIC